MIAGLLVAAFGLRLHRLGDANLWWDEALAIWAARKGFIGVTLWTAGDVHPPLYFWSLWGWTSIAGESETVARLVSVAYGLLLLVGTWLVGRRVGGPIGGGAALVLAAFSRFAITWSMELRMYVGAGAMLALTAYAALRWIEASEATPGALARVPGARRSRAAAPQARGTAQGKRWLAAYVLFAVAATHFIYLAAAGVVAVNLAVLATLVARRSRRGLGDWLAAQAAFVVLHMPWLILAFPRMSSWRSVVEPVSPEFVAKLYATLLATGVSTDLDRVTTLTAAFALAAMLLVAAVAAVSGRGDLDRVGRSDRNIGRSMFPTAGWARVDRFAAALLAAFVVLPPLAVWAATQPRSIFYSPAVEARYLLPFVAPVYAVLGGYVGVALRTRWLAGGVTTSRETAWSDATQPVDDTSATPGSSHMGRLPRLPMAVGAFAVMIGVQLVALPAHYSGRHWKDAMLSMAETIWTVGHPTDVVLLVSGNRYPIARYVYDREPPPGAARTDLPGRREAIAAPEGRPKLVAFPEEGGGDVAAHDWETALERLDMAGNRIWLWEVDSNLQDPDGVVRAWLDANRPLIQSEAFGSDRLHLYGAVAGPSAAASGGSADMGAAEAPGSGAATAEALRLAGTATETGLPGVWASQPATSAAGGQVNVIAYGPRQELESGRVTLVTAGGELLEHVGAHRPAAAENGIAAPESSVAGQALARRRFVLDLGDRAIGGTHTVRVVSSNGAVDVGRLRVSGPGMGERVDWSVSAEECCAWTARAHSSARGRGALSQGSRRTTGTATSASRQSYSLHLTGAGKLPGVVKAGTRLPIDLEWRLTEAGEMPQSRGLPEGAQPHATDRTAGDGEAATLMAIDGESPTVFVHLLGPPRLDGSITWSTADGPPSFGAWQLPAGVAALDRHWLEVPIDALPGDYSVEVGLYYPGTGERLDLSGARADTAADRLILGELRVR